MDVNNLFEHVSRIANRIAVNWNFFKYVTIGLLIALAIGPNTELDSFVGLVLLVLLVLFYSTNFYRIKKLTQEIRISEEELRKKLKCNTSVSQKFTMFYRGGYTNVNTYWCWFYILVCLAVFTVVVYRLFYPCSFSIFR